MVCLIAIFACFITVAAGADTTLSITVDNQLTLYLDGVASTINSDPSALDWKTTKQVPLPSGTRVIAAKGVNTGSSCGLIASSADGVVLSSSSWLVSVTGPDGWMQPEFDDSQWQKAVEVGTFTSASWSLNTRGTSISPDAKWIWSDSGTTTMTVYFRLRLDVDECATNNGGCAQNCVNDPGTFHCTCNSGYTLNTDLLGCTDVDECATNKGGCAQNCVNDPGTFHCTCNSGYTLNTDLLGCTDVDECATNKGGCAQNCVNDPGTFHCTCNSGYTLNTDLLGCTAKQCPVVLKAYSFLSTCPASGWPIGSLTVNGQQVWKGWSCDDHTFVDPQRGINMWVLDPLSCAVSNYQRFDSSCDCSATGHLSDYINALTDGTVAIGISGNDPTSYMSPAYATLAGVGVAVDDVGCSGNYAFIIQKGSSAKTILKKVLTVSSLFEQATVNANVWGNGDAASVTFTQLSG